MKQRFWKMHGAGNDFVLLDDRPARFPSEDAARIRRLCDRHAGIGGEGLILMQASDSAHVRMRFFNPDGTETGMCGNGARCLARLAFDLGAAPTPMTLETGAGLLRAEVLGTGVCLHLPPPAPAVRRMLSLGSRSIECHAMDTGVPHAVCLVPSAAALEALDVAGDGALIRRHPAFAPAGTNADFMVVTGPRALRVRTYERGVEAETPACGTGILACALTAGQLGLVAPPVAVACAHGDVLEVGFRRTAAGFADVTLLGPAAYAFEGTVAL